MPLQISGSFLWQQEVERVNKITIGYWHKIFIVHHVRAYMYVLGAWVNIKGGGAKHLSEAVRTCRAFPEFHDGVLVTPVDHGTLAMSVCSINVHSQSMNNILSICLALQRHSCF